MGLPMKDNIIQLTMDLMKLTSIINLYSSSALFPSHLWLRNNLKDINQDKRKAAYNNE